MKICLATIGMLSFLACDLGKKRGKEKGKEKGTFYFSSLPSSCSALSNNDLPASSFFGRTRGRRLDSKPNSWEVFVIQGNVPFGRSR